MAGDNERLDSTGSDLVVKSGQGWENKCTGTNSEGFVKEIAAGD
jgi:hypothetical protein